MTASRFTAESMKGVGFPPPSDATFERVERALIESQAANAVTSLPAGIAARVAYAELAVIAGAKPTPLPAPHDGKARPYKH